MHGTSYASKAPDTLWHPQFRTAPLMKAVDFYKLPRAIQDRFVGSVKSGFPPAPLLARAGRTPIKFYWLGLSFTSFVALLIVTRAGYGALDSAFAVHSWKALVLYGLIVFGLVFGILQAFARLVRERSLPYTPGVYVFPACLLDARDDVFRVYSSQDLEVIRAEGGNVSLSFRGGPAFQFACADAAMAALVVHELQATQQVLLHPNPDEPIDFVPLDPLFNPRFSSPVGPREPHEMRLPPWRRFGWVVALAGAAVFAPTFWAMRNSGSDKIMFARATTENTTDAYRAYLVQGVKFRNEVSGTLLPRAELKDAERVGTIEALLQYKAAHPGSKIEAEVAAAIRSAMLSELSRAKAVGTLAALNEFSKRYPEHGISPELNDAIHAVYTRELAAYKSRAPTAPKDKTVAPFVERLFTYVEKFGPTVEIRCRHKKSESLGRADQFVAKTPSFMGEVSYPSRQFDDKRSAKRADALSQFLIKHFEAGLSPELFDLKLGAPVESGEVLPDVKVPTLFITDGVEWSGHSYVSKKPRGTYIGILFPFEADFVIPNDPKPLKIKIEVAKVPPALGVLEDEVLMPGPAEEKVYETTATNAFESFGDKLLARFFSKR